MENNNKTVTFLSIWVVNSLLFVIFAQMIAGGVVLGNDRVVLPMATVIAGFLLTLAVYAVEPLVKKAGVKVKDKRLFAVFYFIANFVGIWIIKKLERITGVGISGNLFVAIFAVVATLAQWAVVEYIVPTLLSGGKRKK
ncbi:hypothetical protein HY024_04415 [Candidatus Curtissbacteria bacterium]|nr:hypothetical protein [Candidatus Curtissbacteria bacterium]